MLAVLTREPYPSAVRDDGWAIVAPSLVLMCEAAAWRQSPSRGAFDGTRWIMCACDRHGMPHARGVR